VSERPFAFDPHPPPYATPLPGSAPADEDTHIPGPPPLPTGTGAATDRTTQPPQEPLEEIRGRLASIEDALVDPTGFLALVVAEIDRKAAARHEETMRTLTQLSNALAHVSEGVINLSSRLGKLEPEVETYEARLRLVELEEHAHASNGSAE
jgi:hypothetical protein